jgi:hypothetical protein
VSVAIAWWEHAILVGLIAGLTIALVLVLIGRRG